MKIPLIHPHQARRSRICCFVYGVSLVLLLCSCVPPRATPVPVVLSSAYQPDTTLQVCLDNTTSYPPAYLHEASVTLADRIDAYISPNEGGLTVYIALIEADSFQRDILSFRIPAIPALTARPVATSDPYSYSQHLTQWKKDAQKLSSSLNTLRQSVKPLTNKLRSLRLHEVDGTDIPGCLDDASAHFASARTRNILLIVSDMQNNEDAQWSSHLNLHHAIVHVLYRTCQVQRDCEQNDQFWSRKLFAYGASSVQFFDPSESHALQLTF